MTKISAKIIADSKNEFGNRITTMVVTFPRFILAELNTHRMLSKNSASSRAIPFEKMVESVKNNPFIPIAWQKDHKGMQGTEYFTTELCGEYNDATKKLGLPDETIVSLLERQHLHARDLAVIKAKNQSEVGLTKQLCNRLLEPFMWHTVIITATEWENFFALRCPQYLRETRGTDYYFRSKRDYVRHVMNVEKANRDCVEGYEHETALFWLKTNKGQAEIHMMELAEQMWDAMNESTPKLLKAGEWHIPFGDNLDINKLKDEVVKIWCQDKSRVLSFTARHEYVREEEEVRFYRLREKIATARCARVSYTVVGEEGKEHNYENDIKLHDNLLKSGHMSPFEHCAKAMTMNENGYSKSPHPGNQWSGNFRGFILYHFSFVLLDYRFCVAHFL